MTASSLNISNAQILSSKLNHRSSFSLTSFPCVIRAGSRPKSWRHSGLIMSQIPHKKLIACCAQASLTTESEPATSTLEKGEERSNFSGPVSQLIPNSDEVKFLLTELCDTTSIAEFELKLNGFHLRVTRALSVPVDPLPLPPSGSASMSSNTAVESPSLNGPVSPSSLAITKAEPFDIVAETFLERAANEGLAIIRSPRVGFFRRARTIKGKRAPAACKEKQVVKEGQVICYIEQLGGEIPVESDISGEITKFLCSDGEPVGYGDAIIAILPSFPGIKKLQLEG